MSAPITSASPNPNYWGSKMWFVMHTIAFFFPDEPSVNEMRAAKDFYESLVFLLPCPGCAAHYAKLLSEKPVANAVHSRLELMKWVNSLHNSVNVRLGKSTVGFEEYMLTTTQPLFQRDSVVRPFLVAAVLLLFAFVLFYLRRLFLSARQSSIIRRTFS